MPVVFARTIRALEEDGFRRPVAGLLIVLVLLAGWTAWFLLARVPRYEVSDQARLEVDQAASPLQATLPGRVMSSRLILGEQVKAGEILVELDCNPQRLQMLEERARLATFSRQIETLRAEAAAEEGARVSEQQASAAAVDQARAQLREAQTRTAFANHDEERLGRLHSERLIADRDYERGKADAQSLAAAEQSLQLALPRMEREQSTRDRQRQVRFKQINEEMARIESQRAISTAEIERLQYEIEQRRIRAPIDGSLGEVQTLRVGAVLNTGDRLATIVPAGSVRLVAHFPPTAALGRIRAGQAARLRLDGFPWAQYGSIAATVQKVGSEVRDGRVRVELRLDNQTGLRIPLQHGMSGTLEVEVEEVSPAELVLRAAGRVAAQAANVHGAQTP